MNQATKKNLKQFLIVLSLLAAIIAAVAIPLLATSDIRAEKKRLREHQYAKDIQYLSLAKSQPTGLKITGSRKLKTKNSSGFGLSDLT